MRALHACTFAQEMSLEGMYAPKTYTADAPTDKLISARKYDKIKCERLSHSNWMSARSSSTRVFDSVSPIMAATMASAPRETSTKTGAA